LSRSPQGWGDLLLRYLLRIEDISSRDIGRRFALNEITALGMEVSEIIALRFERLVAKARITLT
jgi:hypothetical protein